jgi:hypothetical protein
MPSENRACPPFSLATRCLPRKPRPASNAVASSLVILLGAGSATKYAAAAIPVAAERRLRSTPEVLVESDPPTFIRT